MPNLWISIPAIQRFAVEDLHPALMIVEIDRPRLILAQEGCHVGRALGLAATRGSLLGEQGQYLEKPECGDD